MPLLQGPALRYLNQRAVFRTIRHAGTITRRQLSHQTALSFQTVSNIVAELFEMKLIVRDRLVQQAAGKPAESVKINPSGLYAVGLLLGRDGFHLDLIDLVGNTLVHTVESASAPHPDIVLTRVATVVQNVLNQADIPPSRFAGVGLAAPGPIDFRYGAISRPPNFPGWEYVPIQQQLGDLLDCSVTLVKDSHAAALAEVWGLNAQAPTSLFYLYFSAGIGSALVINGRIWTGFLGNAGEIGHVQVGNGPACDCGRSGCLEARWSLGRMAADANLSVATLAGRLNSKTSPYWERWQPGLGLLAQTTIDVVNVLEPEVIVIGGPQSDDIGPHVIPALNRALQQQGFVRHLRPYTVHQAVVQNAASIGAALLQINTSLAAPSGANQEVGLDI